MNRLQKLAWYQLVVIIVSLGLTAAAIGLVVHIKGSEYIHFGFLPLILLALVHFHSVFFPVKAGEILLDERDELFKKKAITAAYGFFWAAFILGCLVPYLVLGPKGTITVNYLPWMIFGGMFVVMLVQAIVTLKQYGWGGKGGKS